MSIFNIKQNFIKKLSATTATLITNTVFTIKIFILIKILLFAGSEDEPPLGPLTLFSFIAPTKCEKISYNEQHKKLRAALRGHLSTDGTFLDTKEKGGTSNYMAFAITRFLLCFKQLS